MDSKELMAATVNTLKRKLASLPELPKQSKCLKCQAEFPLDEGDATYDGFGRVVINKTNCAPCGILVKLEEAKKRKERAREEKEKRAQKIPLFLKAVLPERFYQLARANTLADAFFRYVPPCRGLCLMGVTGVGKTTTMALIMKYHLARMAALDDSTDVDWSDEGTGGWFFISYPKFVMQLQDAFKREGERTPYEMLEKMAKTKYLIIDDLGAEKPTEFVRQATYFLINEREMEMRTTFITTNFSMEELNKNIDPRIASRIAGMCDPVEMKGRDRRIK